MHRPNSTLEVHTLHRANKNKFTFIECNAASSNFENSRKQAQSQEFSSNVLATLAADKQTKQLEFELMFIRQNSFKIGFSHKQTTINIFSEAHYASK